MHQLPPYYRMNTLPDSVMRVIFGQLPLADLLSLEGVCRRLKRELQRLIWSDVTEIYWDRFGMLLDHRVYSLDWPDWACTRIHSFVYWGGRLWTKRDWLRLDPTVLCSYRTHIWPNKIGRECVPPPPHPDRPELLVELLRRCGHNLKVLIITPSSLRTSFYSQTDIDSDRLLTQRLIHHALRQSPHLETLIAHCSMESGELLEVVESISPPPKLKRIHLIGLRSDSDHPDRRHLISAGEFSRLLAALPALERLNLDGDEAVSQLSFSGVKAHYLRYLHLPAQCAYNSTTFPTGRQLRELASNFPLLEHLSCLTIRCLEGSGDGSGFTQVDLDYFCHTVERLKLLEIIFSGFDSLVGGLRLGGIASLEHLRIYLGHDLYASDAPPRRLPVEDLGNFPSLRSFAFRYSFEDVAAVASTFATIPPHFTRLAIRGDKVVRSAGDLRQRDGRQTQLGDVALRAIISAMGAGRDQLKELQLVGAPTLTNDALQWLFEECAGLIEFEHQCTLLDSSRLIDDLGAILTQRRAATIDGRKFRLIQYVDYKKGEGASRNLHPLISIEWHIEWYRKLYAQYFHEFPILY